MTPPLERLAALADAPVWAAILRAKDQLGPSIFRRGTLALLAAPEDAQRAAESVIPQPIAQVLDDDGLAIVTVLARDTLSLWNGRVRAEFRSSFRIDLDDRPFPLPFVGEPAAITFERAARDVAAELEAGFRAALMLRPEPDPDASARARYGVKSPEGEPLSDGSVRFAVGHAAATLRPDGENGIALACIGSALRNGRQITELFEPESGPRYELDAAGVERLSADIRAFLCDRRERFARPGV